MSKKVWSLLEWYLTRKIGSEIKCCLTFLLISCFYWIYRWLGGFTEAGIIHMLEMVMLAYVLQWIQVLMHADFDEVDSLGSKEWLLILIGSFVYSFVAYLGSWFDKSIHVGVVFLLYMICAYLCTFLVYKIKRAIDAKHLNEDLQHFQQRAREESI